MNANSLVLPPPGHADGGAGVANNTASAINVSAQAADGSSFAGALRDAAPKAARKPAAKAASGRTLPTPGNGSPPAAVAPQVSTPTAGRAMPAAVAGLGLPALTGLVESAVTRAGPTAVSQPGINQPGASRPETAAPGAGVPAAIGPASENLATTDTGATPAVLPVDTATALPPLAPVEAAIPGAGQGTGDANATVASTAPPAALNVTAVGAASATPNATSAAALQAPLRPAATSVATNANAPAARASSAAGALGTADEAGTAASTPSPVGDIQTAAAAAAASAAATSAIDASVTSVAAATVAQFANQTPVGQDNVPITGAAAATADGIDALAGPSASVLTASRAALAAARIEISSGLSATDDDKHLHDTPDLTGSGTVDPSGALSQLSSNTAPAAPELQAPTFQLQPSVDSGEFALGLTDRVSWMVDNGLNSAKLSVNPPQLGPIELRIAVSGNHAQVWMSTHSAVTRDALASSSPRLREMLGAQGFGQVSVDISQRSFQDRSAYSPPYQQSAVSTDTSSSKAAVGLTGQSVSRSIGSLDAYA